MTCLLNSREVTTPSLCLSLSLWQLYSAETLCIYCQHLETMSETNAALSRGAKFAYMKVTHLMGTLPKDKLSDASIFEAWGKEWVGAMVRGLSLRSGASLINDDRNFWSTRPEISPTRSPSFLRPRRGSRKLALHSRTSRIVRGCRGGVRFYFRNYSL
jgi:hypothetical protein